MRLRRLGGEQPFGMGGHVAIRQKSVFDFEQHVAVRG